MELGPFSLEVRQTGDKANGIFAKNQVGVSVLHGHGSPTCLACPVLSHKDKHIMWVFDLVLMEDIMVYNPQHPMKLRPGPSLLY